MNDKDYVLWLNDALKTYRITHIKFEDWLQTQSLSLYELEHENMTERWDFDEFRVLCARHELSDPTIYTNSWDQRRARAQYHAETAQAIWSSLFLQSFSLYDERFQEVVFIYEANTEACVQALHSLGDILAQIINITILHSHFPEYQVSLPKIRDHMKKTDSLAPGVVVEIENLLDSAAFRYIEAFCNTIKHRCLLNTDFGFEFTPNRKEAGLRFQSFSHKGNSYPITWGSDIFNKYSFDIVESINSIGLKINGFLR